MTLIPLVNYYNYSSSSSTHMAKTTESGSLCPGRPVVPTTDALIMVYLINNKKGTQEERRRKNNHYSVPGCTRVGLRRVGQDGNHEAESGPFPPTWLMTGGGVCGFLSSRDILRLLFDDIGLLGSPGRFTLFCGPTTNSSASSIIIP